ncbi:MAG: helix-turn-helix domain-containing protein [Candidatus Thermoplasmatota archaeon]|nr:helix-turn-helix domain-containing protein [Candidatus Thermoplasmatota archaeon]
MKGLQDLGLNKYESSIYLTLASGKELTASQIAKATGTPRSRVYDVLRGLGKMGLCMEIPGRVIRFKIADPRDSLQNMLYEGHQLYMKELERKRDSAKSISNTLRKMAKSDQNELNNGNDIEIYSNPSMILKRYQSLIFQSEEEVLIMGKLPYLQARSDRTFEVPKPDIDIHFILDAEFIEKAPMVKDAVLRIYGNREHRVGRNLPVSCGIFDKSTVWMVTSSGMGNVQGIVIHDKGLAEMFRRSFFIEWDKAKIMMDQKVDKTPSGKDDDT